MERATDEDTYYDALGLSMQVIKAVFDGEISLRDIESMETVHVLRAAKAIHFVMQEIVLPKFIELSPGSAEAQEPMEGSAFDEYDAENGYDDPREELNIWRIGRENTDRLIKFALRAMGDSWSNIMRSDIICLIDYIKFELTTLKENK